MQFSSSPGPGLSPRTAVQKGKKVDELMEEGAAALCTCLNAGVCVCGEI